MKRSNLSHLIISALLIAMLAISACAPAAPTAAPAEQAAEPVAAAAGGVLRMAIRAADITSLDPHFATTTQDRAVVDMIFNGLLRFKPGDGSIVEPDLATDMPTSEMVDGKQVWTFNLRSGVMCHPSADIEAYELTSDDVLYSLNKSATAETSAYAGEYSGMAFEAPDASTIKITLDTPLSTALFYPKFTNYSGGFIICKKAAEALGADGLKTNPVGTGPFVFKSYTPQEKVELVANETYFRGRPKLDGVTVFYVADLNSVELGLLSGQYDVINGAPDSLWVQKLQGESSIKVDVFGPGEVAVLHFNQNIPPMDNIDVRKAIAHALDRDEFLALVGEPVGAKVYSFVPPEFLPGGMTQDEVAAAGLDYPTDIEMAKKMLTDAGYPDGFELKMVTSEMTGYKVLYESMQAQLAKIGIKIELQVVDHSSMHTIIRDDANPLVIYIAWRPNADVYLNRFFHSDSIVKTGAKPDTNFSHYDKIDDLILQARSSADADEQISLWKDAQKQILTDMVGYPIQYQSQVYARANNVDYGHELKSVFALYPGIDESTSLQ